MRFTIHTISRCLLSFIPISLIVSQPVFGKQEFLSRIPNSNTFSCFTCHTTSIPARNPFGSDFDRRGKAWSATLAEEDSDSDGRTNGEELLDPNGTWREGQPNPENSSNVTNPGVGDVFPTATSTTAPTQTNSPVQPTLTSTPTFTRTTTSSPTFTLTPQQPTTTGTSTAPPTNTPATSSTPTNTALSGTPTETTSNTMQPTSTNTEPAAPSPTITNTASQDPTGTPTEAGPCQEIEIHGEIAAIDPTAQTITVFGSTVRITAQTSIRGEDEEDGEKNDENDDDEDDDHIRLSFDDFSVGDRVEVEGQRCGDVIMAERVKIEHHQDPLSGCDRELHGVITEITGVTHTLVAGLVRIETNGSTRIINHHGERISFDDLIIGDRIEIKYCINESGIPIASEIKLEEQEERERVLRIEGKISAIDPDQKVLTVRGVEIQAGEATLIGDDNETFDFSDLAINDFVRVRGYYDHKSVAHATHVFWKNHRVDDCDSEIRGYVNKIYDATMAIVVGVIEIRVNANTRIEDDRVESEANFNSLSTGLPVKVVYCRATGVPVATKIEIKRAGDLDLDDDGSICGKDLVRFIRYGEDQGVTLDLDGDGITTSLDLFMLSSHWQQPSK